ncbi:PREDICTED: tumor necrosis factor receptor superfamily member 10B-like [Chaetura pelagica]|uniref:tumor necrosis factor receptor superfamily member 10B-like n=1 Tax=Chaetura pelagica TaxID=8897 RepID=UPI000523BDB2|nr:PREDICTED: tumor necrosis factor receptor superfamily member 10B-like [Chaetura pelagica]
MGKSFIKSKTAISTAGSALQSGTYVAEHCKEQNGSSKCLPCKKDEYIEYPNDFTKCLGCQTCREDQVELSPCRNTSNTQCVCRNGTFCSPDHPCEMCQKCRPRCPEGEVELAPCTPHSDRRCGPATTTSGLAGHWIALIILGPLAVVLGVFVLWKCYCHHSSGDGKNLSSKSCSAMDYLRQQLRKLQRGGRGTQDNIRNEQLLRASSPVIPNAPGPEPNPILLTTSFEGVVESEKVSPQPPSLQAKRGSSLALFSELFPFPPPDLRRSFDIFAQQVPVKDWKRFGRALDLLENDIALAETNDKASLEPFFQMLNTWLNRQGINASVNMLLAALHDINLGGIAEDISFKLVQQGYFQYEVS